MADMNAVGVMVVHMVVVGTTVVGTVAVVAVVHIAVVVVGTTAVGTVVVVVVVWMGWTWARLFTPRSALSSGRRARAAGRRQAGGALVTTDSEGFAPACVSTGWVRG